MENSVETAAVNVGYVDKGIINDVVRFHFIFLSFETGQEENPLLEKDLPTCDLCKVDGGTYCCPVEKADKIKYKLKIFTDNLKDRVVLKLINFPRGPL